MNRPKPRRARRLRNAALIGAAVAGLVAANGPVVTAVAEEVYTDFQRSRPDYMAEHGSWETIELPEEYRGQAVHAALLHTGDVLLIAGSGNDAEDFGAGTFRTILWNPVSGEAEEIPTPEDLFCSGHAYLPNGNLLVAGGTRDYEVLADDITHAAGVLTVKNERLDETVTLPAGTRFTARGNTYLSAEEVTVPPAHLMPDGSSMAGEQEVWIEAEAEGDEPVVVGGQQFQVEEFGPEERATLYGQGDTITLDKQNYRGLDASYEYDVAGERYVETDRLTESRWYPTLVGMPDGGVLAVSGLDEFGQVVDGDNEVYDPATRSWSDRPELERYFPTYPALFRLADGRLFYSGSNTGYGPAEEGRQPGIWDLADNSWQDVDGLRDPEFNETSTSFLLAPAQDQRVGIVGGGGVGDSEESTARFDVVDLTEPEPRYEPAATDYPSPARYLNAVTLPDDTTLLTGGSVGYRGNSQSDLHLTTVYDPHSGHLHEAAPNEVGRNYHATALLLPDGRVMTMGSDPLFSDEENTIPGRFETRIEIYSPPYLYAGDRPAVTDAPEEISRGSSFAVDVEGADVAEARLLRPSAVTHQTDPEQRSVALDVAAASCPEDASGHTAADGGAHCPDGCCGSGTVELTVPEEEGLTPSGWYMLVVLDSNGVPSPARWVHVA
ncbi:kelch motif-containing protein [Geodermatophilus normandii]|uniref:DUF1929 domain-containing protein n=1 Tax=Geodermatophilus normandii TaxID=1137989 RepID=A0A6P0GGN8_9ACTN|nr:kelch motif-containing protein [Geodermatophilus normandii]NEM06424.1 DUF1929 domain-containing protein [Geodermatophilus normandii]